MQLLLDVEEELVMWLRKRAAERHQPVDWIITMILVEKRNRVAAGTNHKHGEKTDAKSTG